MRLLFFRIIFLFIIANLTNPLYGQEQIKMDSTVVDTTTLKFVEKSAMFPGGEDSLMSFFNRNKRYPEIALENYISGRVVVKFTVEKDGSIDSVDIFRGIGGGCDEEVVRLVKSMPNWIPAVQNNAIVRQRYLLSVIFNAGYQAMNDPWADPMFPEGSEALNQFMEDNVRFPSYGKNWHGTVKVGLTVQADGKVKDAEMLYCPYNKATKKAILKAVEKMPNWIPARQQGQCVERKTSFIYNF